MPADRFLHPKCSKSHKVSLLTDLEFRVWTQYLLSADDFGVMHATAVQLQSANLHLATKPAKLIQRCLEALLKVRLVLPFTHQGQAYVYQHDWQKYQKVEYPRATDNPPPTGDALALCDEATQALFAKHPGGQRKVRGRAEDDPSDSGRASRMYTEGVPSTRAGAPAKRLTANGQRLTAHGSEGGPGETAPPLDVWFFHLQAEYPQQRVTRDQKTEHAFFQQMTRFVGGPHAAWTLLRANLALNIQSHEWRVKGMIPALYKYLDGGLWQNVLPPSPPAAEQMSKSTNITVQAAANILNRRPA